MFLWTCVLAIPFHVRPENFTVDDGYFYPQIARYIAHGGGSTFNGIMPTNGYHPLWMLLCIPFAAITSASGPLLQMLATVQDLLLLLCLLVFVAVARQANMRGAVLGSVPLLFICMVVGIWRLLETTLALTLQLACLVVVLRLLPSLSGGRLERWRNIAIGVLLGLCMLARLDLIFFSFVVLAYNLIRRGIAPRMRSVLVQGGVASLVVAPYLGWNWLHFHHLLPISGAIKNTFPHAHAWGIAPFMYPVILGLAVQLVLLFRSHKTTFHVAGLLLGIATALQMAYSLNFGELAPWYLTTGYLCLTYGVIEVVDLVLRRAPRLAWTEIALACLILAGFGGLGALRLMSNFTYTRFRQREVRFHTAYQEPKWTLAQKLRSHLPRGSRIFIFDAPGGVAYGSGMSILPADGLVADYAYNTLLPREGFCRYAADHRIAYFIAPYLSPGQVYDRLYLKGRGVAGGQIMTMEAPLTHQPAGSLQLHDSGLIFRSEELTPELAAQFPEVGVWRIDTLPANCTDDSVTGAPRV